MFIDFQNSDTLAMWLTLTEKEMFIQGIWQLKILNLFPSSVRPSQKILFFLSSTNLKSNARFCSGTSL